jgi:hypothetical protein
VPDQEAEERRKKKRRQRGYAHENLEISESRVCVGAVSQRTESGVLMKVGSSAGLIVQAEVTGKGPFRHFSQEIEHFSRQNGIRKLLLDRNTGHFWKERNFIPQVQ